MLAPSKHFIKRCRERAGINKKSVDRFLKKAATDSLPITELTGRYRTMVEDIVYDESLIEGTLIYGQFLILADSELQTAITLLPISKDLANRCRKLKQKS